MTLIAGPDGPRVYIEYAPPINFPHFVTFQVSRDHGETWREDPSLRFVPVPGDGLVRAYDYTAPLNSTSWYRALPFRCDGDTLVAAPYYSEWTSATPTGVDWWLK